MIPMLKLLKTDRFFLLFKRSLNCVSFSVIEFFASNSTVYKLIHMSSLITKS